MDFWGYFFTATVIGVALFVGVFLVLRTFWLWYWRVNEIADTLAAVREELHAMNARQAAGGPAPFSPPLPSLPTNALPPSPQRRNGQPSATE